VRYRWTTDSYHYLTAAGGDYKIEPGDGRWVVYMPYGRRRPWARGKWWSCALPFIQKQNAAFDRLRWHKGLADPLKVIESADGADEKHRNFLTYFVKVLWQRAAGLVTPKNYTAKLVESSGQGYQVYKQGEERADIEIQVSLAGQLVSATGTNGLGGKADLWDTIRTDRIHKYADAWATTVTRDMVIPYTRRVLGGSLEAARRRAPQYDLDARSPAQRSAEAQALKQFAEAVSSAAAMLEKVEPDNQVDLDALLEEQGLTFPRRKRIQVPVAAPLRISIDPEDNGPAELEADAEEARQARAAAGRVERRRA
jgi:phage gp29-like protein